MPQPLSHFGPNVGLSLASGRSSPSYHNPEIALLAMNVIVEWSKLENAITTLFVQIMGVEGRQAAAVFSTIRSPAGQRDAIAAVVRSRTDLDPKIADLITVVIDIYRASGEVRNRIAHWVWGTSPQAPNAVVLADPTAMAIRRAAVTEWLNKSLPGPVPNPDLSRMFVYKAEDFETAANRVSGIADMAGALNSMVRRINTGHGQFHPELDRLQNVPEIRRRLDRLSRDRQSDEEAL